MFNSLLDRPIQALKLVERMCKLQQVGVKETKAILDLCKWSTEDFKVMISVLELYETYETEDVKEIKKSTVHFNEGTLARGEVLTMTNKMLVSLSKVDPTFLVEESENIFENKKSIKTVIAEFEMKGEMLKLVSLVEHLSGEKLETLQVAYPNQFSTEALKEFIGADVSQAKSNVKGEELRRYIRCVKEGNLSEERLIRLVTVDEPRRVMIGNTVGDYDTRVFHMTSIEESEESDFMKKMVEEVVESKKTTVILFSSEAEQLDTLAELRMKVAESELQVSQLLFDRAVPVEVTGGCNENLQFGLISGKDGAFWSYLNIYNGKLENIKLVVEKVTPHGGSILSVTEGCPVLHLHSKDLSRSVKYCSTSGNLEGLKLAMRKEGSFVHIPAQSQPQEVTDSENNTGESEEAGQSQSESARGVSASSQESVCSSNSNSTYDYFEATPQPVALRKPCGKSS